MTGDTFDGRQAAAMKLVNEAVPRGKLKARTTELAKKLMEKNPHVLSAVKLAWRAQTSVDVAEADAALLMKLVDTLEEDDDVQTVWGNYEFSDAVLEKLG